MSEKLNLEHEQFEKPKNKDSAEIEKRAAERLEQAAESVKKSPGEIDRILKKIEKEAVSGAELSEHHDKKSTAHDAKSYSSHALSSGTFNQTIRRVQKKLPGPQRVFSKFVHNSKVEVTSEVVGSTIARPSALLWGGLFSMLSSLVVLILCRYYGFEYNFSIGLISFGGGYFLGLLVESFTRLFRHS